MKTLQVILCAMFFCVQITIANKIDVINSTSGQSLITVETSNNKKQIQGVTPHANQFILSQDNPEPTPTTISYAQSPVKKITITRLSTTMPQIIYYNDEATIDQNGTKQGIYSVNKQKYGFMRIWQDYVTINGINYSLFDLSSFIIKINQLKKILSSQNFQQIEQEATVLAMDLQQIKSSDKIDQIKDQESEIESGINDLFSIINHMKKLDSNLETIKITNKNLSIETIQTAQKEIDQTYEDLESLYKENIYDDQRIALQKTLKELQDNIDKIKGDELSPVSLG